VEVTVGDALRALSEIQSVSLLVRQVTPVSVGAAPAFAGISVDAEGPNASADVRHPSSAASRTRPLAAR